MGRNTFRYNFPEALLKHKVEDLSPQEIERLMNPTLALGHPECGNFSQLSGVNQSREERLKDAADIPLFVAIVSRLKPRFFVMDDLPKSFGAYPMSEYVKVLPDYDLYPEWIHNWGYGNVQKHRKRMFMIGSLKEERWAFVPGETDDPEGKRTLKEAVDDLPEPRYPSNFPNHDPCAMSERAQKMLGMRYVGDRPTWAEFAEYAKDHWRRGQSLTQYTNAGRFVAKPGCKIEYWDEPSGASVQDGGSYKLHPIRFTPLTLRERARVQGFPDDFIFYGAKLNEAGEYNYDKNIIMAKQTGKAMPIQFCRYVSEQVAAHVEGREFKSSGRRLLPRNVDIDRAKQWYCENVGYADQGRACGACWLYSSCTIRARKYLIGQPVNGQADLYDPGIVPGPEHEDIDVEGAEVVEAPTDSAIAERYGTKKLRRRKRPGRTAEVADRGGASAPDVADRAATPVEVPRPHSIASPPAAPRPSSRRFVDLPIDQEKDLF
jgi:DNA (cytosine-5)-methyltransferase 1